MCRGLAHVGGSTRTDRNALDPHKYFARRRAGGASRGIGGSRKMSSKHLAARIERLERLAKAKARRRIEELWTRQALSNTELQELHRLGECFEPNWYEIKRWVHNRTALAL